MADQHGQVPVGHVDDVNTDTELTQDPHEVTTEGEEEAMGEMENNLHPRPQENAAAIAQNAGLSPPVQPENDMMWCLRQIRAEVIMMDKENNRKMDRMSEENSRMEAMSRKMDENSRKWT